MNTNNNKSSGSSSFFQAIRDFGIERPHNRWIAGVCAGIANRTGINVFLIRALFIISPFISFGTVLLFYIALWILLPDATRGGKIIAEGSNTNPSQPKYEYQHNGYTYSYNQNSTYATPEQTNMGTSYSHKNPYTYEQKPVKPRVSATYNWVVAGLIFLTIACGTIFCFLTGAWIFGNTMTVVALTIIFGCAILFAGIKGKKSTGITVTAILFALFVTVPTSLAYKAYDYFEKNPHFIVSTENYEDHGIFQKGIIKLDEVPKEINKNGEHVVEISSTFADNIIITNGKPIKIVLGESSINVAGIVSSNELMFKKHEKENWETISPKEFRKNKIIGQDTKPSTSDLDFYDFDGKKVNLIREDFVNAPTNHSNGIGQVHEIKSKDYDEASEKYLIKTSSLISKINIIDLEDHWFGYLQKDPNNENEVLFKHIASSVSGDWDTDLPTHLDNKDKFVKAQASDLNISETKFENLENNILDIFDIIKEEAYVSEASMDILQGTYSNDEEYVFFLDQGYVRDLFPVYDNSEEYLYSFDETDEEYNEDYDEGHGPKDKSRHDHHEHNKDKHNKKH